MLLESVYAGQLESTRYLERYVNNVKEGAHHEWTDTAQKYSPHEGIEEFPVPVFALSPSDATVLEALPDPLLVREVLGKDIKFFVHPDMADDPEYLERTGLSAQKQLLGDPYIVTPTSSTRTLLTKGRGYEFMVKTDLDKRHYRFIRRLKGSSVDHSIRVSMELSRICEQDPPHEFAFLPESLGVVLGDESDGAGVLFREIIPRPILQESRVLVPYFSLYANDLRSPEDDPILIQLISQHASRGEELDFFTETVLGKIVRNWTHFASEYGMLLETHGQNTLLELDENLYPQRMVLRDFQGLYFDKDVREMRGLEVPVKKHLAGEETGTSKDTQYSLNYDHIVGDYLFHRLTQTFLHHFPQFSYDVVTEEVQRIFRQKIPDPSILFPSQTYTFGKMTHGNDVNLEPKHSKSIWR